MKSAALAALARAAPQLSSIEKAVTYTQVTGTPTYDPATGTVTPAETDYTDIPAIEQQFSRSEKETQHVTNGDMKYLIKVDDLLVVPVINDLIDDGGSNKWRVKAVDRDVIDYMWVLHLTRT